MTAVHNANPAVIGGLVLALVGAFAIWRSGRRSAARAASQVDQTTRTGGTFGRPLLIAAVIVGIQWAVVAHTDNRTTLAVVLGVPALLAGITVARLFAVTTTVHPGRKGVNR